jgi:hypothetical protein
LGWGWQWGGVVEMRTDRCEGRGGGRNEPKVDWRFVG